MPGVSSGVKWLVGAVLATLTTAAYTLVSYYTEHGALPAWISQSLGSLSSYLSMQASFALWEVILVVVLCGALVVYAIIRVSLSTNDFESKINNLEQQLSSVRSENTMLKAENSNLKSPPSQPVQPVLTPTQHDVLIAIAKCENNEVTCVAKNLTRATGLPLVNLQDALYDLVRTDFVLKINLGFDVKYALAPSGRKYVLSQG